MRVCCVNSHLIPDVQVGLRFLRRFADETSRRRQQLARLRSGSANLPVDQETGILKTFKICGFILTNWIVFMVNLTNTLAEFCNKISFVFLID